LVTLGIILLALAALLLLYGAISSGRASRRSIEPAPGATGPESELLKRRLRSRYQA
jgi:hypothetical protein